MRDLGVLRVRRHRDARPDQSWRDDRPRMFVSGYGLNVTRRPAQPGVAFPPFGQADGVAEVLRVVRRQVAVGADVIKMYGSTGSDQDVSGFQTFTYDEIKAVVDAAHGLGHKLAIHSYGPDGARDAVRAGADSIEHATDMDEQTIAEMARRGTFYVPTIDHNRYYVEYRNQFGYSAEVADRLNDISSGISKPRAMPTRRACDSRWDQTPYSQCSAKIPANWTGSSKPA